MDRCPPPPDGPLFITSTQRFLTHHPIDYKVSLMKWDYRGGDDIIVSVSAKNNSRMEVTQMAVEIEQLFKMKKIEDPITIFSINIHDPPLFPIPSLEERSSSFRFRLPLRLNPTVPDSPNFATGTSISVTYQFKLLFRTSRNDEHLICLPFNVLDEYYRPEFVALNPHQTMPLLPYNTFVVPQSQFQGNVPVGLMTATNNPLALMNSSFPPSSQTMALPQPQFAASAYSIPSPAPTTPAANPNPATTSTTTSNPAFQPSNYNFSQGDMSSAVRSNVSDSNSNPALSTSAYPDKPPVSVTNTSSSLTGFQSSSTSSSSTGTRVDSTYGVAIDSNLYPNLAQPSSSAMPFSNNQTNSSASGQYPVQHFDTTFPVPPVYNMQMPNQTNTMNPNSSMYGANNAQFPMNNGNNNAQFPMNNGTNNAQFPMNNGTNNTQFSGTDFSTLPSSNLNFYPYPATQ